MLSDEEPSSPCNLPSPYNNGLCLEHQEHYEKFEYLYDEYKTYVVDIQKTFLTTTMKTKGRANKAKISCDLFDSLSENKYFLYRNKYFRNAVLAKLEEFRAEADVIDADYYINELMLNDPLYEQEEEEFELELQDEKEEIETDDTTDITVVI